MKAEYSVNRSILIALCILVAILAYFGIRSAMRGSLTVATPAAIETVASETADVIVERVTAKPRNLTLKIKGQTAPDKTVTVKSGTQGTVTSTPAKEGSYVKQGALLCGLDVESRAARVKEAEANRDAAKVDYDAAVTLASKGLAPANRETAALAALNAAEAAVNSAKVELSKTQIRAPFAGIFETRLAERGDFLNPGGACGILVDMTPVIVTAEVSEQHAGQVKTGAAATVTLVNGKTYPAMLRYVSRSASPATRTFLIEAALETGEAEIPAGVTAEISIPVEQVMATKISSGLLSLGDNGTVGVRYVDDNNTVHFQPVEVVEEGPEGSWVTGLPETTMIVSKGQDFLSEGIKVTPIEQNGAAP